MRNPLASIVVLLACAVSASAEGVKILQAPGLGSFATIQDAVDAAAEGDAILVGGGVYAPFTLDGKGVTVVAAPGQMVSIIGMVSVQNIGPHSQVQLVDLAVFGEDATSGGNPALSASAVAGHLRVQGGSWQGGNGTGTSNLQGAAGGPGVRLDGAASVAFLGTTIRGGHGYGGNGLCYECTGGHGGAGILATTSAGALYDCFVRGGDGGDEGGFGGDGGHGYDAPNWGFYASGSTLSGGDGGDGLDFLIAFGGDGGDGVVVGMAQAQLLDTQLIGGQAGIALVGFPGNAGQPSSGPGKVNSLSGNARALHADTVLGDGGSYSFSVMGQPGDRVRVNASRRLAFGFIKTLHGVWLLPFPQLYSPLPAGTIGAGGTLLLQPPTPLLRSGGVLGLDLQSSILDAAGQAYVTGSRHLVLLDRDAAPDCDGNGTNDLVEIVEGTSPDCNGNLELDGCEVDCNANGIPDDCDIASGFSQDLNGNGIPDECESSGTVWHVDAAAAAGGTGSVGSPFQHIGQGIAVALPGDTVLVADGLYSGPSNVNLSFGGRDIVVRSANGSAGCIIDCQGQARAFVLINGNETAAARIEGFTIRNGRSSGSFSTRGGGICVITGSPTISDVRFEDCIATSEGGGMYYSGRPGRIEGCVFLRCSVQGGRGGGLYRDATPSGTADTVVLSGLVAEACSAGEGGGVYVLSTAPVRLSHSRLWGNVATGSGGGLRSEVAWPTPSPILVIDNCLIEGNHAAEGAGIHCGDPFQPNPTRTTISSSTIVANTATGRGGALLVSFAKDVVIDNSILWANSAPTGPAIALDASASGVSLSYDSVQGLPGSIAAQPPASVTLLAGNTALDPLFVDPDGPDNDPTTFADNDWTLRAGSPAVDSADASLIPPDTADIDADGNLTEPVPLDLAGSPRRIEDPATPNTGPGAPPVLDMGAFERKP